MNLCDDGDWRQHQRSSPGRTVPGGHTADTGHGYRPIRARRERSLTNQAAGKSLLISARWEPSEVLNKQTQSPVVGTVQPGHQYHYHSVREATTLLNIWSSLSQKYLYNFLKQILHQKNIVSLSHAKLHMFGAKFQLKQVWTSDKTQLTKSRLKS